MPWRPSSLNVKKIWKRLFTKFASFGWTDIPVLSIFTMHSWQRSPGMRSIVIVGPSWRDWHQLFDTSSSTIQRMLYIVMPYCEGGDLDAVINTTKRNKMTLPEDKILRWSAQVSRVDPVDTILLSRDAILTGCIYLCRLRWRFTSCMKTV